VYFEIYQHDSASGADTRSDRTGGEWRWRLKGANNETIASGEGYVDHADCLHAVYLVRRTSSHTPIRDV
jgi:uncharacterized protein YegP (UPF0339 family)